MHMSMTHDGRILEALQSRRWSSADISSRVFFKSQL